MTTDAERAERDYQDDRDYWRIQDRQDRHAPAPMPTRTCADCGVPPWGVCVCRLEDPE